MILPLYMEIEGTQTFHEIGSFDWRYPFEPGRNRDFAIASDRIVGLFTSADEPIAEPSFYRVILRSILVTGPYHAPEYYSHHLRRYMRRRKALLVVEGNIAEIALMPEFSTQFTAVMTEDETPPFRVRPQNREQEPLAQMAEHYLNENREAIFEHLARLARNMAVGPGDADRTPPEDSKPLAPLPEWLNKVDAILNE